MNQQVGEQVKKDVDRLVSIYDDLLEEKSQQLQELKNQIEELENYEIPINSINDETYDDIGNDFVIIQGGNYIDDSFFAKYNMVKNEFRLLSYDAMKETVSSLLRVKRDINVHEFKELLSMFDYKLQYEMDTLDSASQLEIIELIYTHSMGKRKIVERYLKEHPQFSFENFVGYLRNYIFYHDSLITVFSHEEDMKIDGMPKNVVFEQDLTIGEGYIVRFRDKYYDFSLKGGLYE